MDREADARELILEAGERLFAARGFAATTIKQIGREAGVNPALLYYYFEDKDALYGAVLEAVFARMDQQLRPGLDAGSSAADAIGALVRAQIALMSRHPAIPHLLVREMMDHHGARARAAIARIAAGAFARLCEVIRDGQRRKELRVDLVPEFAAISCIAQVAYFFIARPAMGILLGEGPGGPSPDAVRRFGDHAAAFALGALGAHEASVRFAAGVHA